MWVGVQCGWVSQSDHALNPKSQTLNPETPKQGCGLVVSAAGSPDEIFENLEEGKEGQFLDAEQHGRDGQASERNEVSPEHCNLDLFHSMQISPLPVIG